MKMTAAVLVECGKPLHLMELEIPKLRRGQVLVKIAYSAICRSQLMEINGLRGHDKWLPHLLGHEASGVVVDVGAEVTKVKPGQEVILTWIESNGIEAATPQYSHNGRAINAGPITTFSNYSIVSENRVVLKPEGLDMDVAVLFGCALATGSGMVLKELDIRPDQSVVVLGLGGVGMGALLTLLATGHKKLVAVDSDPSKCVTAESFGSCTVCSNSAETILTARPEFASDGFDICIEAGGSVATIELGFSLLKAATGVLLFASHPPQGERLRIDPHELIVGKQIKGSWGGALEPDLDIPTLATVFAETDERLRQLTASRFGLREINEAIKLFSNGEIFRPILKMEH
tara:strand:+ start:8792 stop:9829 length:1038 start_codon:yes stop_codon:yes gene_type:complete